MKKLANAIRFLAIDMVEKAQSGHPGMPMGMADIATVLFAKYLRFNPLDANWFNRDRFIISNGHGSALLYSLLYLVGYHQITIEELKRFRQLGSLTPGHPEYGVTPGVETTTGPLGQGIANAVGIALSHKLLQARFGAELVNHRTWVFCGDGCLQEGLSHEAASFAGHLKLDNLIVIYDHNAITIDGSTSLSFSENISQRFNAYGWSVLECDGHDFTQIDEVLAQAVTLKGPVIIKCKTQIGYGSPNKMGSAKAHGSPLGAEEVKATREFLDWPYPAFEVPQDILEQWRSFAARSKAEYDLSMEKYNNSADFKKFMAFELQQIDLALLEPKSEATRVSSGKVIEYLVASSPKFLGGSADLTPSNNTFCSHHKAISSTDFTGNYLHYGVREHAMAAIMNGIALYGAFIPYGATFLTFADYMRPAMRLSALMKQQVIYIMTHDSIGLGEDGPTHQPVEHLAALRLIPNLYVFRPCDAVETRECWQLALNLKNSPSVLALSRQNLLQQEMRSHDNNKSAKGAYIIKEYENKFKVTIFATGSEVEIACQAAKELEAKAIGVRVVSVPCMELFFQQGFAYIQSLLGNDSKKVAIEAAVEGLWPKVIGQHGLFIGMHGFGDSAPAKDLYEHFGITAKDLVEKINIALSN